MKIILPRKELHDGLQIVARAVSTNTTLPVLKNILLEPGTDSIRMAATDLELGVEVLVPAVVQEPGAVTVPARMIVDIVGSLPEADVSLAAAEDDQLFICCRRSEFHLHGLPAEEFPSLPEVGTVVSFDIPQPLMRDIIRQTAMAASADDTRPILMGVNLTLTGGSLRVAATDTHRLALRTTEVASSSGDTNIIVPVRALNELVRALCDDPEEMLHVRLDQNQILFQTSRVTLVSRLIEGQFPRFDRVIPTQHTRRLTIPREDLIGCLRRVRILARDADSRDRIVLHAEGDVLTLTARSADAGDVHDELEVAMDGEEITFALNVAYLLDALNVIDTEAVFLELTEPLQPTVLRPLTGDDYLVVIMPMQVK